jgi:hypothetical protein
MKKVLAAVAVIPLLWSAALTADARVYDLKNDWSTTTNPNGVWSYRAGDQILPLCPNYGDTFGPVPAWAVSNDWAGHVPVWLQAQSYGGGGVQPGDIVCHTTAGYSTWQGEARVVWSSDMAGEIQISGNAWMARDIARSERWRLYVKGNLVSWGDIWSGDPYSYANPFDFRNGSGGQSVLRTNVAVGDQVILEVVQTWCEDYVGTNLRIESVPEPSSLLALLTGAAGLCGFALRRRK